MQNASRNVCFVVAATLIFASTSAAQYPNQQPSQRSNQPRRQQTLSQQPAFEIAKASYITSAQSHREQSDPEPELASDSGFPTLAHPTTTDQAVEAQKSSSSKSFGPLVTTGCSLAVVLGLFAGLVWITRRYGNGSMTQNGLPSDAIKSLGSTAIDARTRVTLVRCGSRIIVMAQTASGVHPLSEITDPVEVQRLTAMCKGETVSQAEPTFAEALRQANHQGSHPAFSS